MSYNATVVEVFLSSPSDVGPERELILDFAAEWNSIRSRETECFLSILTWEGMVAPALKSRSQEAVNDQVGSEYDVYLGVMWTRFGTPTGSADSGTVEEFDLALERARRGEQLRIATLFKKALVDPSEIDAVQLQKVNEFKKRLGTEGVFYREFSDDSSLRSIISLLFEQIAKDKSSYLTKDARCASISPAPAVVSPLIDGDLNNDEDEVGLLEVGEEFEVLTVGLLEKLTMIGAEEEKNTNTIHECTEEIAAATQFGKLNSSQAKTVVNKASQSLLGLADFLDKAIGPLEDDIAEMARLIDEDLRIRLEFDNPMESAIENIESLEVLSATLSNSADSMLNLIRGTDNLPRMSSDIAKAKKRLSKLRQRLRDLFLSLNQSITNSVSYFKVSVGDHP